MGYETQYDLKVTVHKDYHYADPITAPSLRTAIETLRNESREALWSIDSAGNTRDEAKWYDHEGELVAFSVGYPGVLFTLTGRGENLSDLWTKYFLDGAMYKTDAQITYEAFDEEKLTILIDRGMDL